MNYSQRALELLQRAGAEEGDTLSVKVDGKEHQGVLMPHHQFSHPDVVVLKLKSGYNVGIRLEEGAEVVLLSKPSQKKARTGKVAVSKDLPTLSILGTGGTIASYVDYRTGAVHPALSAEDLMGAVPEITNICNVKAKVLFSIFSENMNASSWAKIAEAVIEELDHDVAGIIIPHGTDTLGYTAAALSFMLEGLDRPVVLVGAQRSSDRPSSDAYTNLVAAARFCVEARQGGVFVLMHEDMSDRSALVHLGTRARKMHSSRRDAFHSINSPPFARVHFEGGIELLQEPRQKGEGRPVLRNHMEERVALLQYYPGMSPDVLRSVLHHCKGMVLEGSGLGHVSAELIPVIAEAVRGGTTVVMTSQCLQGRVNLNVYATGRDLINAGVIPGEDMLPETALVKLMWVLAQTIDPDAILKMMSTDLRGEISARRELDA